MTLGVKLTEQIMTSRTGKCLFLQNVMDFIDLEQEVWVSSAFQQPWTS